MIDGRRSPSRRRGREAAATSRETPAARNGAACFYLHEAMHAGDDPHLPMGSLTPRPSRRPLPQPCTESHRQSWGGRARGRIFEGWCHPAHGQRGFGKDSREYVMLFLFPFRRGVAAAATSRLQAHSTLNRLAMPLGLPREDGDFPAPLDVITVPGGYEGTWLGGV